MMNILGIWMLADLLCIKENYAEVDTRADNSW